MTTPGSSFSRDAMSTTRQASDNLTKTAASAMDSTRDFATRTLDKAEANVSDLRGAVDPLVDMLTTKAQKLGRQSMDLAAEAKDRAQQSLSRYANATTHYVSEQPLRSVVIAAAVGAAVALLISAARRRDY